MRDVMKSFITMALFMMLSEVFIIFAFMLHAYVDCSTIRHDVIALIISAVCFIVGIVNYVMAMMRCSDVDWRFGTKW